MGGDMALLLKHELKVKDIIAMLQNRRQAALRLPESDLSRGLIRGIDEADELFTWTESTGELPHFSMSLEAWRGFRDIGIVWQRIAEKHSRPDLATLGKKIMAEAVLIKADVDRAIEANSIRETDGS